MNVYANAIEYFKQLETIIRPDDVELPLRTTQLIQTIIECIDKSDPVMRRDEKELYFDLCIDERKFDNKREIENLILSGKFYDLGYLIKRLNKHLINNNFILLPDSFKANILNANSPEPMVHIEFVCKWNGI